MTIYNSAQRSSMWHSDERQSIDPDTWNEDVAEQCGYILARLAARGPNSNLRAQHEAALAKASIDGIDNPAVVVMTYGVGDCPPVVGPGNDGEDTRAAEYEAWL
ncbi:MAG: hypothetical protein OXF41_08900 [bacterium]|nr:hypothetical protein [bacterium]